MEPVKRHPLQRRLAAAILCAAALPLAAGAAEPFDIAITVDDLPSHGRLPPGMTRLGIAQAHIKAFREHGVKEAYGFVNASKLTADTSNAAVLDLWRRAGHPLGNHTFSHLNLARADSLAAWQADVIAGEPAVESRMANADWRWFRAPNLAVADGSRRDEALAWLQGRGYRFADVSIAFSDWNYTDPYARCVAKGDRPSIDAMKAEYLRGVDRDIVRTLDDSRRVYGRVIPLVLLTHAGGFSAMTLPDVLKRLDAAGARYVTLKAAQSDPAYAAPGGGNLITRAAKAKGIHLASDVRPGDTPAPVPLDLKELCK